MSFVVVIYVYVRCSIFYCVKLEVLCIWEKNNRSMFVCLVFDGGDFFSRTFSGAYIYMLAYMDLLLQLF